MGNRTAVGKAQGKGESVEGCRGLDVWMSGYLDTWTSGNEIKRTKILVLGGEEGGKWRKTDDHDSAKASQCQESP